MLIYEKVFDTYFKVIVMLNLFTNISRYKGILILNVQNRLNVRYQQSLPSNMHLKQFPKSIRNFEFFHFHLKDPITLWKGGMVQNFPAAAL